jgi:hypothetical protein
MIGTSSLIKNIEKKVIIDNISVKRKSHVNICVVCAKTSNCKCQAYHLCTSAEYWVKTKERYSHKIMGKYRLILHIRKINYMLKKNNK